MSESARLKVDPVSCCSLPDCGGSTSGLGSEGASQGNDNGGSSPETVNLSMFQSNERNETKG